MDYKNSHVSLTTRTRELAATNSETQFTATKKVRAETNEDVKTT